MDGILDGVRDVQTIIFHKNLLEILGHLVLYSPERKKWRVEPTFVSGERKRELGELGEKRGKTGKSL
jgi:hypothetical protein